MNAMNDSASYDEYGNCEICLQFRVRSGLAHRGRGAGADPR